MCIMRLTGNRAAIHAGLECAPAQIHYPLDYSYAQIPGREVPDRVPKGQTVTLSAACSILARGCTVQLAWNPALAVAGRTQPLHTLLGVEDGRVTPEVRFTATKDTDLSTLGWLVRIYVLT